MKEVLENINKLLHYQGLLFILEIIQISLISHHYNNTLADHFDINKIRELIDQNYYGLNSKKDVKIYIKGCNVCLALKIVK